MIELLVEAERALTHGRVDQAERLYQQVAASDPKSSIAVMGLARVALERGDDRTAYLHARAALSIDAENPAAQHLVMRLAEVMEGRGETPPSVEAAPSVEPPPRVEAPVSRPPTTRPSTAPSRPTPTRSPGLVARLLRRKPRPR
jgi:thioredoxin-like negative regulator of GroEL